MTKVKVLNRDKMRIKWSRKGTRDASRQVMGVRVVWLRRERAAGAERISIEE